MPKTRDAFALKQLENIFTDFYQYGVNFHEYFKQLEVLDEVRSDLIPTENTVGEIFELMDKHITEIEKLDEAEKTRERLRRVNRLITRIDRHIKRLSNMDSDNRERQAALISSYDSISMVLSNFEDNYHNHYRKVLEQVTGEFSKFFGDRLRKARYLKEMSQVEVAKEMGVVQNSISRYERGEREPPLYLIHRFAKLYGVTVEYLMGFKESPFID